MAEHTGLRRIGLALAALAMAALACSPLAFGARAGPPVVTILSPEQGSSVPMNEVLEVEVNADDPEGPGVARLDLLMDGMVVETFEAAAPQANLSVRMNFTPDEEGALMLTVIAYREDGTASQPASIALSVVTGAGETTAEAADEAPASTEVRARVTRRANLLERPGAGCPVVGTLPRDAMIDLLRRTTGATNYYYETDYLGDDNLGWVSNQPLDLLDDDGALPRQPEATCLTCGDGTCSASAGEACDTCATDCGTCAASAAQPPVSAPPVAPGPCPSGPGNCCGDGVCQTGETADWCDDCQGGGFIIVGSASVCGDGTCGTGEDCNNCAADCPVCFLEAVCGDGYCDVALGENCRTCRDDCDLVLWGEVNCVESCGDGTCQAPWEDCNSCPDDCGLCGGGGWGTAVCGDSVVDAGEACDPPGSWCGLISTSIGPLPAYCEADCTCPN